MRRERTNIACAVIVAALAAAAFFGTLMIPGASAQRQGYVEKRVISTGTATGYSAFANQLAPDPVTGMCLQADVSNKSVWGPCGVLPSGDPGQIPQVANTTGTYTTTATGTQTLMTATQTTTTTEWKSTNGTIDFDPMGTFFLGGCEGPCAIRWKDLSNGAFPYEVSGTCSSGSDALLGSFAVASYEFEYRELWPAGTWMVNLRARVDANGAAIRVEVWDQEFGGSMTQWFNWTTDVFTNTSDATITKMSVQGERSVAISPGHYVVIKLYATCSTSTLVTVTEGRVESPFVVDAPTRIADVYGLQGALDDKETLLSGIPGQFVKIAGTGTSVTTSKEAVTVVIPTPVTTRKFSVPASAFSRVGGGTSAGQLGSYPIGVVPLRDSASDYAYSYVLTLPADYSSSLSVSVIWSPGSTDSTSAHTVKWRLGYMTLVDGTSINSSLSSTAWTGDTCGTRCTSAYILKETAHSVSGSLSAASSPFSIYFQRDGSDANDTYVGTANFIGLEFSYTSSL